MNKYTPREAKTVYNQTKAQPSELVVITAKIADWIVQGFHYWAYDESSLPQFTGEIQHLPVKWELLLQSSWWDVQKSIQKILWNSSFIQKQEAA